MITDEELKAFEDLVSKVTPGPWNYDEGNIVNCANPEEQYELYIDNGFVDKICAFTDLDVQFIAASRTIVPKLIAELKTLASHNRELENMLSKYHDVPRLEHCLDQLEDYKKAVEVLAEALVNLNGHGWRSSACIKALNHEAVQKVCKK